MTKLISGKIDLHGKVAIVTGAAQGIGKAVAVALAREGAKIIASDIRSVGETIEIIMTNGGEALGIKCDVTQQKDIQTMIDYCLSEFGKIDILVTSAGVCKETSLEHITTSEWDFVQNVNMKGTFLCCQAVLPIMKANRYGKIVAVGSQAGRMGSLMAGVHYAASKGGVHAMMKCFAKEGAADNVYVNTVAPGIVRTELSDGWEIHDKSFPLQRWGEPEDIAEAVVFLSSQASNWITGITLDINGGMLMCD